MTNAMAANNLRAQKVQATKADIDSRISTIMSLDAQIKEMEKKLKQLKIDFAAEYFVEDNATAENITGDEYEMKKIPVLTKKAYDTKALKVLLEAAGVEVKSIVTRKMVETVNEKELDKLVKSGKVTQDMVDKTISGNQNYKMTAKRLAD